MEAGTLGQNDRASRPNYQRADGVAQGRCAASTNSVHHRLGDFISQKRWYGIADLRLDRTTPSQHDDHQTALRKQAEWDRAQERRARWKKVATDLGWQVQKNHKSETSFKVVSALGAEHQFTICRPWPGIGIDELLLGDILGARDHDLGRTQWSSLGGVNHVVWFAMREAVQEPPKPAADGLSLAGLGTNLYSALMQAICADTRRAHSGAEAVRAYGVGRRGVAVHGSPPRAPGGVRLVTVAKAAALGLKGWSVIALKLRRLLLRGARPLGPSEGVARHGAKSLHLAQRCPDDPRHWATALEPGDRLKQFHLLAPADAVLPDPMGYLFVGEDHRWQQSYELLGRDGGDGVAHDRGS